MLDPQTINPLTLPSVPLLDRKNLHRWGGIYFLICNSTEFLYIGQSPLIKERWNNHQCLRLLTDDEKQRSRIHWLATDEELKPLEAVFIHRFQPSLNRYYPALTPSRNLKRSLKVRRIVTKEIEILDLNERIAKAQKDSGKAIATVCKMVGFSRSYWYQMINGKEDAIAEETLRKIEEVLDVDFGVKFDA